MTIRITQEDIAAGVKGNCNTCPAALALQRHGFTGWEVWSGEFRRVGASPRSKGVKMSLELADWIDNFDSEQPVAPMEFEFEPPATT